MYGMKSPKTRKLKGLATAVILSVSLAPVAYAAGGEALRLKCRHMLQDLDYVALRREARKLCDEAASEKDTRLGAYASYYLAASELKTGSVASARRHAAAADSLAAISGNDTLRASSLNVLGIIANEYSRNNALALGYYLKALDYAGRVPDNPVTAGIYSNISLLFISHNDTAGLRYCKESYRIGKESGHPENLYYPCCNLASAYLLSGNLGEAYRFASEAVSISDRYSLRQPELAGIILGSVLGRMGRYGEATATLDGAITSLEDRNPKSSLLAQAYFEKARVYNDIGDFRASIRFCSDALRLSDELGNRSLLSEIYALAGDNYKRLGDFPAALEAIGNENRVLRNTVKVQDETIHREISRAFDLINKEKQLARRDVEISLHRQRIGILIAALMVMAGVLALVYRNYRRERALNRRIVSQYMEQDNLEEKLSDSRVRNGGEPSGTTEQAIFDSMSHLMEKEKIYLDKGLTRDSLAERLGTNRTYITKIVKGNTGLTLPQWINRYRVKHARLILSDPAKGGMSVKDIADASGFSNVSTFNVVFKESVGMSPTAYRRSASELQE